VSVHSDEFYVRRQPVSFRHGSRTTSPSFRRPRGPGLQRRAPVARPCNWTARRPCRSISDSPWQRDLLARERGALGEVDGPVLLHWPRPPLARDDATTVPRSSTGVDVGDTDGLEPLDAHASDSGAIQDVCASLTCPDFFGGAVGFVSYDYVRRLERLPREPAERHVARRRLLLSRRGPRSATTSNTRPPSSSTRSSWRVTSPGPSLSGRAHQTERAIVDILLGAEPPSDAITERLVATAPSQRSASIDVRDRREGPL
jgi:hypothetical protein